MRRLMVWAALCAALVAMLGAAPARAADDSSAAAQAALGWLLGRQMDDGSFPGFDAGGSADAIFAIVASGGDPNGVLKNGNSPVSYLGTQAGSYATKSPAAAGKLALAVVAAGKDPLDFGGQNLIALILQSYDAQSGRYGAQTTDHVYALLALAATGQSIPPEAIAALNNAQLPDGGWPFDGNPATGSDTNTAALAIQALIAANARGDSTARALDYLKTQQNTDGGFPYSKTSPFGSDTDANSTAVVLQALAAAGEDPHAWRQNGDPVEALLALRNANGAFRYQAALPDDNDLATAQAVPALLLKGFPLRSVKLPAVQAAPAPAPAEQPQSLPRTGGEASPAWLLALALALLAVGFRLRPRKV